MKKNEVLKAAAKRALLEWALEDGQGGSIPMTEVEQGHYRASLVLLRAGYCGWVRPHLPATIRMSLR